MPSGWEVTVPPSHRWLAPVVVGLVSASCNSVAQTCTEEFRIATVTVVDAQSAPITDATVTTTLARTGQVIPITSIMDFPSGTYPVLDDGAVPLLRDRKQEDFNLTVTRPGQGPVTAMYRFEAQGGCHIEKLSGADTLHIP
jgi:hypothetical protein